MPSEIHRIPVARLVPWWGLLVALVFSVAQTAAGDPADDDPVDVAPPDPVWEISDTAVYDHVFGDGTDRDGGSNQLDTLLRQRIAIVNQVCRLTDDQKQKLQLAGRGDVKRLLDRVEGLRAEIQSVRKEREKVYELLNQAHALRRDFIRPGLSSDSSLFLKLLPRVLTEEQIARFAPLEAIVHAGGLVRIRRSGTAELLEVTLPGSVPVDDALAHVPQLPGFLSVVLEKCQVTDAGLKSLAGLTCLHALNLNHTHVTDAGLAELKDLIQLTELALDDTQVTNAGLVHLEGLTALQFLSLKNTRVSDAGLAHLRGLTRLEWLALDNTDVTDAAFLHVEGLVKLQIVLVRGTQVTEAEVAALKHIAPRLAIHRK